MEYYRKKSQTEMYGFVRIKEIAAEVMKEDFHLSKKYKDEQNHRYDNGQKITSGIGELDKLLGEFVPGGLYSIFGRPGVGKTALLLDIVLNISATTNKPIYFVSLESSAKQIVHLLIRKIIGNKIYQIAKETNHNENLNHLLSKCWRIIDAMNLYVYDKAPGKIDDIEKLIKRNVHNGILFIDYFQLLNGRKDKYNSRITEMEELSAELKDLSKKINITIVCASQADPWFDGPHIRAGDLAYFDTIEINHFGSLGKNSDGIIFINREGYYCDNASDTARLSVVKNTYGNTGMALISFDSDTCSFK